VVSGDLFDRISSEFARFSADYTSGAVIPRTPGERAY